ncbi:MAG: hypothetical protein ACI4GA_04905 [Acutalibacteraceae bacterium]
MKKYDINYFLGANSPKGFVSFFDELYLTDGDWRCFVLKGGPGTGKSTLMKGVAKEIERRGYEVELIPCSSDPDSLDAVTCEELKVSIADGTSPHVIEPLFPGAVESIVNLGEARNDEKLHGESDRIISLTRANSACHARCIRFLKAAGLLVSDSRRLCESAVLEEKASLYVKRFIKRSGRLSAGRQGREKKVFLSAVTPKGIVFFRNTVRRFADQIIEIEDPVGLVSSIIVENLRITALKNGLDVITGYCPLDPTGRPEHIIIPEYSVAFIRKHAYYGDIKPTRTIHAKRFTDIEAAGRQKQKLNFNRKAADEMINEAVLSLKKAKEIHDELEEIYISSMDFDKLDEIRRQTVSRIFGES